MVMHEQIPKLAIDVERELYRSRTETKARYVDAQVALKFIRTYLYNSQNGSLPDEIQAVHDISTLFDGGLHEENMTPEKIKIIHEKSALVYEKIRSIIDDDPSSKKDKWKALYMVTKKLRSDCVADGRNRYRRISPVDRFSP